jgi:ribosomal protein S7
MIPIYEKGIKSTTPNRKIDLQELYQLILNGTHRGQVETIRHLKQKGDDHYKTLKQSLPNITPQVDVKERNLSDDHFTENFICFTGFLYFDLDNVKNVLEEKQRIIKQYGNQVALVCLSSSGAGLSILVRVSNEITKGTFPFIWNKVRTTLLKHEKVDPRATGIGRAMFISYDPDVFVNNESVVDVDMNDIELGNQPSSYSSSLYNSLDSDLSKKNSNKKYKWYHVYNLDEILANIKTKTIVPVSNPVVDFKEVEVVDEIRIMFKIRDDYKHAFFYRVIHQLYFLNKDVELDYIFSYLFFINNNKTMERMQITEMARFFNSVIENINRTGEYHIETRIKRVHFNPDNKELSGDEKKTIASVINGAFTRWETRKKIDSAIELLNVQNIKPTNRAVAKLIGMSVDTISDRKKDPPIDMDYEVSLFN